MRNKRTILLFDGVDDYVEIPHDDSLSLTNFTVKRLEVWVEAEDPEGIIFIPINNPSFENPAFGNGGTTINSIPGWNINALTRVGVFDPLPNYYNHFAVPVPDGENTNWASGEPNNYSGNEDYTAINWRGAGIWNDYSYNIYNLRGIVEIINGTSEISVSDVSIAENATQVDLTVTLKGISPSLAFTVDYATSNNTATEGDDYLSVSGTLTFNPGEGVKTISIPIEDDNFYEGDEDFSLTLSNPTGGAVLATQNTATVTIIDDDLSPTVTISPATISQPEGNSETTAYTYTVTLSNPTDQIVTVNYSTNDETATVADGDYIDNDGTLIFNPNESLSQEITILVKGDTEFEENEEFTVKLDGATNATIATSNAEAKGIIENNDAPSNNPHKGRFFTN